jgi:hypothetical protein
MGQEGGQAMYVTDLIWLLYSLLMAAIAAFMLWFGLKVREKGG